MINLVSITSGIPSVKTAFVYGNIDDTVTVTRNSLSIVYDNLTTDQKTTFDDFFTNLVSTDKNVTLINLPYNSDFSVDYITDSVTFVDLISERDYAALSGASKGYIDAFNQLILDLLGA